MMPMILMKVHTPDCVLMTVMSNVPLIYPSLHPYTPKFTIYIFLFACILLLCVSVVPSLLLQNLLQPIPIFRREVLFSTIHSWIEHFSNSFQEWL